MEPRVQEHDNATETHPCHMSTSNDNKKHVKFSISNSSTNLSEKSDSMNVTGTPADSHLSLNENSCPDRDHSQIVHHERLGCSPQACSGSSIERGDRRDSRCELGNPEDGDTDLRSDLCGSHVRGVVEPAPKLDQVVLPALQEKHEGCPQEGHHVHREAHCRSRIVRTGDITVTSDTSSKEPSSTQSDAHAAEGQIHAKIISGGRDRARATDGARQSVACHGRPPDDSWIAAKGPQHGERHSPDPVPSHSGQCGSADSCTISDVRDGAHERVGRSLESMRSQAEEGTLLYSAGEIDEFCETMPNQERKRFWALVELIEKEYETISKRVKPMGKPIHLMEVFCSSDSSLTKQVQQLGGHAIRFGLAQGDLQTVEGRKDLLTALCRHCPKHVWLSPRCGPWSCWSNFNQNRSLQMWDKVHSDRLEMLVQVALCLVLSRIQVRNSRHVHWEQPKGSLMLRLPYVQEIFQYMLMAQPDLCNAGNLRDPINQKPIRKGLNIATTSQQMFATLDPLRCNGQHEHQVIEGSTFAHGQSMPRSVFSEFYPRKFARIIAKVVTKVRFPNERPLGPVYDPILCMFDQVLTLNSRPSKRPRLGPSRSLKAKTADRSLNAPDDAKRLKTVEKESEQPMVNMSSPANAQEVMSMVEPMLPRVGRKEIDQPNVLQLVQKVFPDKRVVKVIACKGTERALGPPKNLNPREAPYRRAIMKSRTDLKVYCQEQWEQYDQISNRQINKKLHPCRVNITVFAANLEGSGSASGRNANAEPVAVPVVKATEPNVNPPKSDKEQNGETVDIDVQHRDEQPEISERATFQPDQGVSHPSSAEGVQDVESHGPRFKALPREEQAMLKRAHQNLCHPSPEQLSTALRNQGVRPEVSQAVFDMSCPVCAKTQKPKIARPSTLKCELDFNDKVFLDGITWTSQSGKTFHFYHLIDQATNFHVAVPAPNRSAESAIQCVTESWLQWAGPPNSLITDSATEFTSELFGNFMQRHDIKPVTTAPYAHWQNGRCERHGDILQHMLMKIDLEMPINSYDELHQALVQSTHAKNTLSIRKGYSPEVLVFGKGSRLPGSNMSSESESSMASADRADGHGISFRRDLALRERARTAFHQADNDMALRRAFLRRTRPERKSYSPGEWIMMWQPTQLGGHWFGPLKVVSQEDRNAVWAPQGGKLHRRAPEHVRPVCSQEARQIQHEMVPANNPAENTNNPSNQHAIDNDHIQIPVTNNPYNPPHQNNPEQNNMPSNTSSTSQDQPDNEPEASTPHDNHSELTQDPAVETPVPELPSDDELVTTHILCCEEEILTVDPMETPCAWRCELEVPATVCMDHARTWTADEILLATADKRQRTEVKLSALSELERKAFQSAKETEINNWLKTGTVSKVLRSHLAPEQILRCRWILVWKPLEDQKNADSCDQPKLATHKPKARLVVLGYLDPNLTEVPRDSPTLGKQSKMLILQLVASMGWSLGSFDIRAAFLQGKPQKNRIIGLEPVPELAKAMKLKETEVCKLEKSAYGLIDAPFLWFQTLQEELTKLGFVASPFDPCVFVLRHPDTQALAGILGVHVDDGIHGGDEFFHQQISKLESKYPFGSKKSRAFTFTGIDLKQNTDNSITLSQSKYIKNINSIQIKPERRAQENENITEAEKHLLRGLIGSLQYAAVHTRPDLTSSLSQLQSKINCATVQTLIMANKTLHIAKKHSDVTITIHPIKTDDLRFIAFSDASFASKSKPESHAGMIILSTHKDISQNRSCLVSPLSWGTKKIQRIVTSTLSAETSALSTTLDQLTWLRLYWAWILNPKIKWQRPESVDLPAAYTVPTVKIEEKDLAITDCKSLFDLTTRTAVPNCQEFRTQLLARSIKDILSEGISLHWVHSGAQLADALTKVMEASFLRETLKQGRYCLHDENEVLKNRASARNRLKWLRSSSDQMSSSSENF